MNGSMHRRRLAAYVLHNVNLTAVGPTGLFDVIAEHPECGPDTLSIRDLDARFEPAICLELANGLESSRAILASTIPAPGFLRQGLIDRCNHQVPVTIHRRVASTARVILQFVVSPSVPADLECPFRAVYRRPFRSIELIAPD